MSKKSLSNKSLTRQSWLLAACATGLLSACGGESPTSTSANPTITPQMAVATGITTVQLNVASLPADVASQTAEAKFHVAPVLLNAPDVADAVNNNSSAFRGPRVQEVPAEFRNLSSRRMTAQTLQAIHNGQLSANAVNETPMSSSAVGTYTPAQIRAAYGLPSLPSSFSGLTASQAASLGAGQTIYLIDANNDPNVAQELAAFNQSFGLPTCTTTAISVSASLPLAAPSNTSSCSFSVVYNTASGTMTSTAPAYDSGWATEITLDVQWSHATAPLARIILIEAPDSSLNSLIGAVALANKMGPGVVSMSFGSAEGNWTSSVDSTFTTANMTYLAATGDSGAAVQWPAVSANVLAVGGTSLTYTGSGSRSETGWADTGGGTSAYVATPGYQSSAVPGMGVLSHRTVADVSFNADPNTGQYLAVIPSGSSAVSWLSAGGTSLATPQWAGIIAVANAERALSAKAVIGQPQTLLYSQISTVAANYASAFLDVTKGSDGSCATCNAKVGYDQLTGLGTPNVSNLLPLLGATTTNPPVVTAATINGQVGTALSFTVSATAPDALTYALTGAPSGMAISSTGIVTWATPVVGTYPVVVTAKDSKTGLSGTGTYTVVIAPMPAPVVTAETINGKAGTALSFNAVVSAPDTVTYSLTGAPSGMTISTAGAVSWATPVTGTYAVTVAAKGSKSGLTGQAVYTVIIASNAPVVTAETINGKVGTALSFSVTASGPDALTYSMTGAPSGMTISTAGVVSWATPVAGTYSVVVTAKDSKTGLSGFATYTVIVAALPAPVVTAASISGKVGTALSFTVSVTAPDAVTYSLSGAPSGMAISTAGVVTWATPVAGTYAVTVTAKDSKTALSGSAVYTVTIAAATPVGPVITAPAITGVAGKALTSTISISDPGVAGLSVSISGVPLGMSFSANGLTITASWPNPVTGIYSMTVVAMDTNGHSSTVVVPITITAH